MNASATGNAVLYEARGAIALLTLNRPEALNSLTRAMHQDLWAALDRAEADPAVRTLVFTGAGRGFCAGADLSEFDFAPGLDLVARANPGPVIEQAFNPTTRRLQSLRMPTVCAVNGVAAGAGASFAMACDIAIAAPSANFIQAFAKIGLIPDAGGSWQLAAGGATGPGMRHGACHDRRQIARGPGQGMGNDLGRGRRSAGRSPGSGPGRQAGRDADQPWWPRAPCYARPARAH